MIPEEGRGRRGRDGLDGRLEGRRGERARWHPAPSGALSPRCLDYSGHRGGDGGGGGRRGRGLRQRQSRRRIGRGGVDFCEVAVFVYFGLVAGECASPRVVLAKMARGCARGGHVMVRLTPPLPHTETHRGEGQTQYKRALPLDAQKSKFKQAGLGQCLESSLLKMVPVSNSSFPNDDGRSPTGKVCPRKSLAFCPQLTEDSSPGWRPLCCQTVQLAMTCRSHLPKSWRHRWSLF